MKRKSKGQLAREQKISERENNRKTFMETDPWFRSLPVPVQLRLTGYVKEQVDKWLETYEVIGYEKGMLDCMTCVIQVLKEDYWKKAPKKKWLKFAYDVSDLMNSHLRGVVTWDEMIDYIKETTDLTIETKWMGKDKRPTVKDLFGGYYEETVTTPGADPGAGTNKRTGNQHGRV